MSENMDPTLFGEVFTANEAVVKASNKREEIAQNFLEEVMDNFLRILPETLGINEALLPSKDGLAFHCHTGLVESQTAKVRCYDKWGEEYFEPKMCDYGAHHHFKISLPLFKAFRFLMEGDAHLFDEDINLLERMFQENGYASPVGTDFKTVLYNPQAIAFCMGFDFVGGCPISENDSPERKKAHFDQAHNLCPGYEQHFLKGRMAADRLEENKDKDLKIYRSHRGYLVFCLAVEMNSIEDGAFDPKPNEILFMAQISNTSFPQSHMLGWNTQIEFEPGLTPELVAKRTMAQLLNLQPEYDDYPVMR